MQIKQVIPIILILLMVSEFTNAQWKTGPYSISFQTRNAGFQVEGTISGLNLEINPPSESNPDFKIRGSVNVKTLSTQNRTRDHHLMKEDYFDADQYPNISMESVSVKKMNGDLFQGSFKLTLKNITKTIQFPFRFKIDEPSGQARLSGEFHINRRDFHVGGYSMILSDSIRIKIQANLNR